MPLFISALWGAFISIAGTLVGQVLLSIGISYLTFTGVDASIGWAKAQFLSGLTGLPAAAVGLAGVMKVGVCVSMLLAAVTTRVTMLGMQSGGKLTQMTVKGK
jgi:hypothetical protein